MKKETDYLLEDGLAVAGSGPWSWPWFTSFITDYRKVSGVTVPDSYLSKTSSVLSGMSASWICSEFVGRSH